MPLTRLPADSGRDAGFSLVELTVAMAVTSVLLAAVTWALTCAARAYTTVQDTGLSADRGRVVLDRFDRDLRQVAAVNPPGAGSGGVYVEYETGPDAVGGASTCTQWRFAPATHELSARSWPTDATTAPAFSTVASGVVNDPVAEPPFVVAPAGGDAVHQQLTVTLRLALAHGQALTRATVTARNSVAAAATGAGVCTTFGRP